MADEPAVETQNAVKAARRPATRATSKPAKPRMRKAKAEPSKVAEPDVARPADVSEPPSDDAGLLPER
jgi:hypothetical protein